MQTRTPKAARCSAHWTDTERGRIPVSVDGNVSPQVPDSRQDDGQSARMGITHYPALFLVDPKSKNFRPLAYGFMTQDDLAKRFLNVATGFKPNF